jgi:hypothetical protein
VRELSTRLPRWLAPALGYHGEGRYAAFFWHEPDGVCCICPDGVRFAAGAGSAFALLRSHPVLSELHGAEIGARGRAAELWLVAALWERRMYLAEPAEACRLLRAEPSEVRLLIRLGRLDSSVAAERIDAEATGADGRRWRALAERALRTELRWLARAKRLG